MAVDQAAGEALPGRGRLWATMSKGGALAKVGEALAKVGIKAPWKVGAGSTSARPRRGAWSSLRERRPTSVIGRPSLVAAAAAHWSAPFQQGA